MGAFSFITNITRHYNRTLFFASGLIFLSSVNYDESISSTIFSSLLTQHV